MSAPRTPHVPVMLREVLAALALSDGDTIVDATFGAGGYSSAILEGSGARVVAIDRDPAARVHAAPLEARFGARFRLVNAVFSDMEAAVAPHGILAGGVAGVVLDIGVSSMQLDEAERGFSFMADGPLDMRMSLSGPSAADVLAMASETEIADILYHLGEERRSRAIAREIVKVRAERPLARTSDLAQLVIRALRTPKIDGRHAATRTFQALRMHVNDELDELRAGLSAAERLLAPDGRLVVVTFHSLEDGLVKRFLQARTGRTPRGSRHGPAVDTAGPEPSFRFLNHRALSPTEAEVAGNPRSRSARLRQAIRTPAPAWPDDQA
ncbi:MAG: 16S rRNA (cytosine(1402)-N(4))-methyltransferase RsmH [Hyphomicrobiales bacterium]|nr:16S rRNA (cytosine(1402)-N(4))-methyltransferase RsmH [Hyphomicrobiales bacterium]